MRAFILVLAFTAISHGSPSLGASDGGEKDAITSPLPGLPPLADAQPFGNATAAQLRHYSGYLQVSDTHYLHYWFIRVLGVAETESTPVVFWLNGGPGCSSLFGLLRENGPFLLAEDGKSLEWNKHGWAKTAKMIKREEIAKAVLYLAPRFAQHANDGKSVFVATLPTLGHPNSELADRCFLYLSSRQTHPGASRGGAKRACSPPFPVAVFNEVGQLLDTQRTAKSLRLTFSRWLRDTGGEKGRWAAMKRRATRNWKGYFNQLITREIYLKTGLMVAPSIVKHEESDGDAGEEGHDDESAEVFEVESDDGLNAGGVFVGGGAEPTHPAYTVDEEAADEWEEQQRWGGAGWGNRPIIVNVYVFHYHAGGGEDGNGGGGQ